MPNEQVRAAFYRLATAIIALLVLKGVITKDESDAWSEVVVAIIGLASAALASANTSLRG